MAIRGAVTRAAIPEGLQQSGNRFGKEVHLGVVMEAVMTLAAVMMVPETHVEAVAVGMEEVIPAMVEVTPGIRGVRQPRQDLEVHLRLQHPLPTMGTRGEVMGRQPPAAVVVATATSRATTDRVRRMAVAALLPHEAVAPTVEAPTAVPAVAVVTGDECRMHARWMAHPMRGLTTISASWARFRWRRLLWEPTGVYDCVVRYHAGIVTSCLRVLLLED